MSRFLWLDLETTGLDPDSSQVLEVAAVVTDGDLVEVAADVSGEELAEVSVAGGVHLGSRFESLVVHDMDKIQMQRWPWKQHTENGLLDDLDASFQAEPMSRYVDVDGQLATFIRYHSKEYKLTLAGSSIHFDRSFMRVHLPKSLELLYYRQFDVSSLRPLVRWMDVELPEQEKAHRAMADVENSLALARHFKELVASR